MLNSEYLESGLRRHISFADLLCKQDIVRIGCVVDVESTFAQGG